MLSALTPRTRTSPAAKRGSLFLAAETRTAVTVSKHGSFMCRAATLIAGAWVASSNRQPPPLQILPLMRTCSVIILALAAVSLSVPAAAQGRAPSVELGLGFFAGGGGGYAQMSGVALDAVIAVPVARIDAGTLLLGVTGGI